MGGSLILVFLRKLEYLLHTGPFYQKIKMTHIKVNVNPSSTDNDSVSWKWFKPRIHNEYATHQDFTAKFCNFVSTVYENFFVCHLIALNASENQ